MKIGEEVLCVAITHPYGKHVSVGGVYRVGKLEKNRHHGYRKGTGETVDGIYLAGDCPYWLPQSDFISLPDEIDRTK